MTDSATPSRRSALSLLNVARALKLIALLLFFLPWVTVSCVDQTLVSMSGYDLATGAVTAHNPLTGQTSRPPGWSAPDISVALAAILIVTALGLSFLARRAAPMAAICALALAAALIAYTVLIRLPEKAREGLSDYRPGTGGGPQIVDQAQLLRLIRVETAAGFWLTLAALLGAIVLLGIGRRDAPPG